ncbi:uncharacterized protein [Solanum lycopersicum]|uniref:uncharacterized protein isoform X2 n=1 Tax=Solanum lycopersicum TaxID=4081 RepID=UPI00374A45D9
MNYKAFTLISFVLFFCQSSIMASRRILSGPGSCKMPALPHRPPSAGSATPKSSPQYGGIPMRPHTSKPEHFATNQHPLPEYVGIPMRPHYSKPYHSATDPHSPPAVIHPPPAR